MNYELKDKLNATTELLNELENKGWQEVEYLQAQIANLAEGPANNKLRQLLKNLLTSYYVFTGGIEILASEPINNLPIEEEPKVEVEPEIIITEPETEVPEDDYAIETTDDYEVSESFEYFVDFDEPIGEPLTDKDLYNN